VKRRSRLAALLVALVAVGMIGGVQPRDAARAGDPLADAKAKQQQLQAELARQRAQLASLRSTAASLSRSLSDAEAHLKSVSARYESVAGQLAQVRQQVADVKDQLAQLNRQIATLGAQLKQVAADIVTRTNDLAAREALLQDHLRTAYEQSQTSLLEVLLSARSLDDATNQVGYLLTVSDQDKALADEITLMRQELQIKQQELEDLRATVGAEKAAAEAQKAELVASQARLSTLQRQLAALKREWEAQKATQEAALNASLRAEKNLAQQIAAIDAAAKAQAALVKRLLAQQTAGSMIGPGGMRWPETNFVITQYFGPTTFALEPPYTYNGVYYAHFHTGIDISSGCGSPIVAAANGVVAASGQPLAPYDSAYGVIINHGAGIQTWYWHMLSRVIVRPGQAVTRGQLIGYEGATGFATGCHVHFAVNANGTWRNPMSYLP
jgi:murein DD-endopeptidase MepM/ murein hydrolase activator NlpD